MSEPAPLTAEELSDFWGPAMRGLPNDRWRAFVKNYVAAPPGRGRAVRAYAAVPEFAGSRKTMREEAHKLLHDQRVVLAISEERGKMAAPDSALPMPVSRPAPPAPPAPVSSDIEMQPLGAAEWHAAVTAGRPEPQFARGSSSHSDGDIDVFTGSKR